MLLRRVDLCFTNYGLYESMLIAKQPCCKSAQHRSTPPRYTVDMLCAMPRKLHS